MKVIKDKDILYEKLEGFGFTREDNYYEFKRIIDSNFYVLITIKNDIIYSKVIDSKLKEEYILVDVFSVYGEYIGKIKSIYEETINNFILECTKNGLFQSNQSNMIITYIKEKYNDDIECLWEKFPNNGIWRNKENNKWYCLLLTTTKDKFGFKNKDDIEIIDLKYQKDKINDIIDNKKIFPGYHMNKNSWITIILDNGVDDDTIISLIDNSYNLINKKIS